MGMYEGYATLYDASGQRAFSLRMIPYLERLWEIHQPVGKTVVDLACGTGTVALHLAHKGWRVTGVDASAAMLSEARIKQEHSVEPISVTWLQQDMRQLDLEKTAHVVTCLYDSMTYMLRSEDLVKVFKGVYDTLVPGGLFCFDMNTAWVMAAQWDNETYFSDMDSLSVILQSNYDDRAQRTHVTVTCFERVDDLYRKIVEHHTEQAYPPEQIATHLQDVGLRLEAQYSCFTLSQPTPTTYRIMFVARRV